MNYDLRYDGPDVEGEAGNRTQSLLTLAMMANQGRSEGRTVRDQKAAQREAATLQADQLVWRDTPAGAELASLDDDAIARRWVAAAAHPGEPDANEVRGRLEAELTHRDPETMRDYRSWRNAAGRPPGNAMHNALGEREKRLADQWTPLTGPGVQAMSTDEVLGRWADAHAAHGTEATADALQAARAAGEKRLTELDPTRVDAWKALQAAQPSPVTELGSRPGLSQAAAASRTAGRVGAFLPGPAGSSGGWAAVAKGGVQVATTTARTTAVLNPVTAAGTTVATTAQKLHQAMSWGMRP